MKPGLHTLFSPVNRYPNGDLHPAPYDFTQFKFDIGRPPEGLPDEHMDIWVAAMLAAGRTPIVTLDPTQPEHADQIAQRFKGRVQYYEFGNEPSYPKFWSGTPADFAAAMSVAYRAIKTVDPAAKLISGGLDSWQNGGNASKWLTQMLDSTGGMSFDILGVHLYAHGNLDPVAGIGEMMGNVLAAMWSRRIELKPIWCTEVGILAGRFRDLPRWDQYTLCRGIVDAGRKNGLGALIWYAADHDSMGFGCNPAELADSVKLWNAVTI